MSLYDRAQAEASVRNYTRRQGRKTEIVGALLGDGAGNIDVSGEPGWVWVRPNGDPDGVAEARNRSSVPLVYGIPVDLRVAPPYGYELIGLSSSVIYENPTVGPGTGAGVAGAAIVAAHAPQHSIGDHGISGFDPLTVNVRALAPLRARAQTTPDMTVQVDAGYYFINSFKLFPSTTSGAFSAPVPPASTKYDLLYLGSDDALHILAGTPAISGTPTFPAVPTNSIPICFVFLSQDSVAITESQIVDARVVLTASVPALTPTTGVTSISKSGSALLVGDVTLSEGANITLTQAGQDIQIAAPGSTSLGIFNVKDPTYGAVGNGSTNDTTAVQAAITAAAVNGGVVYFPPGTYLCDPLTSYPNVSLIGAGQRVSVIKANSSGALITITSVALATGVGLIAEMRLFGNAGTGTTGLDISNVYGWKLERVEIYNFATYGLKLRGALIGQAHSCAFTNNGTGANLDLYSSTPQTNLAKFLDCKFNQNVTWGLHAQGSAGIYLDGCDVESNGTDGNAGTGSIYFKTGAENETFGLKISNSWFEDIHGKAGILIDTPAGTNLYHVVEDTQFNATISSTYGIYVEGASAVNRVVCRNVEFRVDAATKDFFANGINATLDLYHCTGTTGGTGTINSYPPYGSSPSANTPQDVGSTDTVGTGTNPPHDDHVHKGVHSIAKSGGTALYGDVTLSGAGGIALNPSGNNLEIDGSGVTGTGGGGTDHLHGLARWLADGSTTNFELPDQAEYLEWATDNGSLQDQTTVSLAATNTQLAFGSAPTAGHVIQAEYVIQRI